MVLDESLIFISSDCVFCRLAGLALLYTIGVLFSRLIGKPSLNPATIAGFLLYNKTPCGKLPQGAKSAVPPAFAEQKNCVPPLSPLNARRTPAPTLALVSARKLEREYRNIPRGGLSAREQPSLARNGVPSVFLVAFYCDNHTANPKKSQQNEGRGNKIPAPALAFTRRRATPHRRAAAHSRNARARPFTARRCRRTGCRQGKRPAPSPR